MNISDISPLEFIRRYASFGRWDMGLYDFTLICEELPHSEGNADEGNHPADYCTLTTEEQAALHYWIKASVMPARGYCGRSSYSIKHDFEREGFYITNGQFKGAMLLAGYLPRDVYALNWTYKIKPRVSRRSRGHGYNDLSLGDADRYSIGHFDLQYARLLVAAGYLKQQ